MQRTHLAPAPRTLLDVFRATADLFPDAHALDNGSEVLSYADLAGAAEEVALELAAEGIGRGDRVGVRISSGTTTLYVAILGIMLAGAAYVPVDADDPDERARKIFEEAGVAAILGNDLTVTVRYPGRVPVEPLPTVLPEDDAWIIFTSGSTGQPKGVGVTHRAAAAFVDAESRLFLQADPINDSDRVMAGLSVAFDASCEEMWLAWRRGACLVPAPRSLVKSGMDLGPWLVAQRITVVSTVPTLAMLWPPNALERVRLLILGGEACPPEIATRYASGAREVWNTYGPTETTVVACAAQVRPGEIVRIGFPLDGWDLAVLDPSGEPVAEGAVGELVIGGVGLARYLDPAADARGYGRQTSLGWERAYRSGDLVVNDPDGLVFVGRADEQVKIGGRRVELGELDAVLSALPGVRGGAAAVQETVSGAAVLVGYLVADPDFDTSVALEQLRALLPAALVPRLAVVGHLPTRTSGKIDRAALPWPMVAAGPPELRGQPGGTGEPLSPTEAWLAGLWQDILGTSVTDRHADFFDLGGTSLGVAHLVARIRERQPEAAVTDIYDHGRLADMAERLAGMDTPGAPQNDRVPPVRRRTQVAQLLALLPLRTVGGVRWLIWLATLGNVVGWLGLPVTPVPWPVVLVGWLLFILPPGRIMLAALGARVILRGVVPGRYPRGGRIHLRLWLAERLAEELGATGTAGAWCMTWYARLLGATIGRDVDMHTVPPITGFLTLGDRASVELEVDLAGYWLDGDVLNVGAVTIGRDARVGMRSTLGPDALVGDGAEIGPGSVVLGKVPAGEFWTGSPAHLRSRGARGPWTDQAQPHRAWVVGFAIVSTVIAAVPASGIAAGLGVIWALAPGMGGLVGLLGRVLLWLPVATLVGFAVTAVLVLGLTRLFGVFVVEGHVPVRSLRGLATWGTVRLLDEARHWLYPLYAGWFTPVWLRLLGAQIGRDAEASTVLLIPKLASVGEGAFLADDTLLGGYELGAGWLRVARTRVGRRAFLGNSAMVAPGRKVPARGLVAVLSSAPARVRAKKATSWIGSPPTLLRRQVTASSTSLTFNPPVALRVRRALVEACRIVAVMVSFAIGALVVAALVALASASWWLALALSGLVLLAAGYVSTWLSVLPKRLLVGTVTPGEHPLWSSFVWRNELVDQFVELVTAPWFVRWAVGTPLLNAWLRGMGARIGKGVWCETYWLPEPDLVQIGDGATIERGCVVQTHLFHDRVLALDTVVLRAGSTLCPNSVVLPGAIVGRHATVGPASLVMRGESLPRLTRWIGNPIRPWNE